jgi:PLP dependent protein
MSVSPDPCPEPSPSEPAAPIEAGSIETGSIADRIAQLRATIPASVRLIAVTKTRPIEDIRAAYRAGLRDFGENRVQEAIDKQAQLQDLRDITWHLIGPLQSNKVRKALEHFDWIHSLDNPKLIERLNLLSADSDRLVSGLLQVKLRPDPNKIGWDPADLFAYLPRIAELERIHIRGLMTISPQGIGAIETSALFDETAQLAYRISVLAQQQSWSNIRMDQLSMGMSGDYQLAIGAQTTMVRLGQTIFGNRGL